MAKRNWTHQLFVSSQKNPPEEQRSFSRSRETVRPLCPGCLHPSLCSQCHAPNKAHIYISSDFTVLKPCLLFLQDNRDEPQSCRGHSVPWAWIFHFVHPSEPPVSTAVTLLSPLTQVGAVWAVPPLWVWMRTSSLISSPRSQTDSIRSTSLHPPRAPLPALSYLFADFVSSPWKPSLALPCLQNPQQLSLSAALCVWTRVTQALESSQLATGRCKKFCLLPTLLPTSGVFFPNPASPVATAEALDLHVAVCKTGEVTLSFAEHFASLLGGNLQSKQPQAVIQG